MKVFVSIWGMRPFAPLTLMEMARRPEAKARKSARWIKRGDMVCILNVYLILPIEVEDMLPLFFF